MPGNIGLFIKRDGRICARLGITEDLIIGNAYHCESSSVTLEDFSCGVTGCFGIINGILHFREGMYLQANFKALLYMAAYASQHAEVKPVYH